MPNVTFYFEVHQPIRMKREMYFDNDKTYVDTDRNKAIFNRVTDKCYIPATDILLSIAKAHPEFKVSFSFTGTFFEQAEEFRPEVIQKFQELFDTGNMDILDETYYHSLAYLISAGEFSEQVSMHKELMKKYFNYTPRVFRNTEAMYSNDIGKSVERMGYKGIVAEGWDKILGWRSPNYLYSPPNGNIGVLLRNYRLSDDIGFRFSSRDWPGFPLTADKYADWISKSEGDTVNIFIDYETFGEHQWKETGIFEFLRYLPDELIRRKIGFNTVSETADLKKVGVFDSPNILSWADVDRDLSAWLGNKMQDSAFKRLRELEKPIKESGSESLLKAWRYMQTSDNFYYMCTKWFADGDIHKYFNFYDSPYLAYINYMNILFKLDSQVKAYSKLNRRLSGS
ncbi:MAG: glycoside hydrolase family 57 protein [Candidatus Micrarchaeaceae archaeon]|nr:glycoside hydrolase family 57 protein [Candidatus Parvarchaeota archaeon]